MQPIKKGRESVLPCIYFPEQDKRLDTGESAIGTKNKLRLNV